MVSLVDFEVSMRRVSHEKTQSWLVGKMFHDFYKSRKGIVDNYTHRSWLVFPWELCSRAHDQCSSPVPHPQGSQCLMTNRKRGPVLIAMETLYCFFRQAQWDCPKDPQDWDPPILWSRNTAFLLRDNSPSEVQRDMFSHSLEFYAHGLFHVIQNGCKFRHCTLSRTYKWTIGFWLLYMCQS